ncbi:hypothetical protein O181_073318 [Austropuccinia psidii MF-1]|uniref:Uncharacterized protein n=1 Tax=Austropuccinia psidii MF-1 TaxID=1389203 RepID=A0A9Q3I9Y2_9BASI|nr:hypothetical protein [Austropuccinia psidii MF-1]
MPNARNIYQAIKNRFNRASWSSIVHHAGVIFNPVDHSSDITQHALRLGEAIAAIENQIGTLDSNKIIMLSLFFSLPHLRNRITCALDNRMVVNPSITVQPEEILDIVRQMSSQSSFSPIDESSQLAQIETSKCPPDKGKYRPPSNSRPCGHFHLPLGQSMHPLLLHHALMIGKRGG